MLNSYIQASLIADYHLFIVSIASITPDIMRWRGSHFPTEEEMKSINSEEAWGEFLGINPHAVYSNFRD